MKKIKLIYILILLLTSGSFYSQLVDNPYAENFSRGNGIWNGDLSYSSYAGYYNPCTGTYMASDNVWSSTGDVEFETVAACGQTLGGDVTITITYQANDYNDPNIPIGNPEFSSLKIYTKNSIADSWTIRSTIPPSVGFCQIGSVTYSTTTGDEVWVKIVFAWGSGDWILSLDRVDITEASSGLPVNLASFTGELSSEMESIVLLNWTALSQVNNDYFTVEKSLDGYDWEELAILPGAGSVNQEISYSIYDENPIIGPNYYRLTQTDYDGKFKTFRPIAVTLKGEREEIIKRTNLLGQPVKDSYIGIVILTWDNNDIQKIYQNK